MGISPSRESYSANNDAFKKYSVILKQKKRQPSQMQPLTKEKEEIDKMVGHLCQQVQQKKNDQDINWVKELATIKSKIKQHYETHFNENAEEESSSTFIQTLDEVIAQLQKSLQKPEEKKVVARPKK